VQKCSTQTRQLNRKSIDLVDTLGECKNLRKPTHKNEYASTILSPKSVYILVDVNETTAPNELPTITAILTNSELLTSKFLAKLANINVETKTKVSTHHSSTHVNHSATSKTKKAKQK
jgi:hypothetical protein